MNQATFAASTVRELGTALRSGATSPIELTEIALDRVDRIGRALNAVVTTTPELAREAAEKAEEELAAGVDRGPLHGIPYGAKDLLAVAGYPTTWGAVPFADQRFDTDAHVITRLREAGAVLVAKVAMVELAGGFGYEQPNASLTGPGRCAWDPGAWSGGSSSGSGSAVGAGCVPFAIGTETWGSIHCPSAFNGITGLRPTYGRVSRAGAMALSWTMDKIGPMARDAAGCAAVYRAIADDVPAGALVFRSAPSTGAPPPRFRFGVFRRAVDFAQPEVASAISSAIAALAPMADLEEIDLPDLPWDETASIIVMAEAASAFEEFLESGQSHQLTAPEDRAGLHHALVLPAVDYIRALRIRRLGGRAMDHVLARFDALIAPTYPYVASPIDHPFATYFVRDERPSLGAAGNLCGLPSITVPCGFGERGLPVGLEFLGRAWDEERLLSIAHAFQEITDWHRRLPAIAMD